MTKTLKASLAITAVALTMATSPSFADVRINGSNVNQQANLQNISVQGGFRLFRGQQTTAKFNSINGDVSINGSNITQGVNASNVNVRNGELVVNEISSK